MSAQQTDDRHLILQLVRKIWVDGYLRHSLENIVRIELGLEENLDAVSRPWELIVQQPDRAPRPLPPGQAMSAVFDDLGQSLLILGAPGAGKTTLLLELTRDLLDRAEQDASYPMPMVFHLSSWAVRRRPLADWLVDELASAPYYVSRKLAQDWLDNDKVLPLLDGLDEIAPEHRAECVEAINTFRRQHGRVPLAVCCRTLDYQALSARVELFGAVVIEPLSRVQVSTYLKPAGKPLAGVRTALRDDETLWELLDTPLMLSIVTLAYRDRSAAELRSTGSLEERRAHLFTAYARAMFERRSTPEFEQQTKRQTYTREQTIHWLTWLARSLMHNNLSIFYVEWTQPDWLPSRAQRWIVATMPIIFHGLPIGLLFGLLVGLSHGLLFGLISGLLVGPLSGLKIAPVEVVPVEARQWSWRRARNGLLFGLISGLLVGLMIGLLVGLLVGLSHGLLVGLISGLLVGLLFGLLVGLLFGLISGLSNGVGFVLFGLDGRLGSGLGRITPAEALRWSWRKATRGCAVGLAFGLAIGLAVGLAGWLGGGLAVGLAVGLAGWLGGGLTVGLGGGLLGGLHAEQIVTRTNPNEGIRQSLRNALITLLTNGLLGGLLFGLVFGLAAGLEIGLAFGLAVGLLVGLAAGLEVGGLAYLKHYVLRFLLWLNDYAPWNYIRFLDYAAERVFLRKVGGGYIFTHRLLMEYFATLEPPEQSRQAKAE